MLKRREKPKSFRRARPTVRACALACALAMLLGGCAAFDATGSDLFSLPKLAGFVVELQTEIDKVLAEGGEYSAPTGGVNRQSVQMEDLDGDGAEEAILFLRTAELLKICVFRADDAGGYGLVAEIESEGASFDSISYADLSGNGRKELVVGISLGSGMPKALSVVALDEERPQKLLTATYTGYTQLDIDGDGAGELIVARHDAELLSGEAEVYRYSDGALELAESAPLSEGISSLKRLRTGYLRDGAPAVFITGLTSADGSERMLTDICAYRDGSFENITLDAETGQSREVVANVGVSGSDIDGDGVFDLPMAVMLATYQNRVSSDIFRKIVWRSYSTDGEAEEVMQTFHNSTDGWYFVLPKSWESATLAVDRRSPSSDERVISFSFVDAESGAAATALEIYVLTGDNRESRSTLAGRFVISNEQTRTVASTIYSAKLYDLAGTGYEDLMPSEEEVAESFRLIQTEWFTGELTN